MAIIWHGAFWPLACNLGLSHSLPLMTLIKSTTRTENPNTISSLLLRTEAFMIGRHKPQLWHQHMGFGCCKWRLLRLLSPVTVNIIRSRAPPTTVHWEKDSTRVSSLYRILEYGKMVGSKLWCQKTKIFLFYYKVDQYISPLINVSEGLAPVAFH